MWVRVLEKQTGEGVDAWNSSIRESIERRAAAETWLSQYNVTGYAQQLLVMELHWTPSSRAPDGVAWTTQFVYGLVVTVKDTSQTRPSATPR